jgi:hypothetical protein
MNTVLFLILLIVFQSTIIVGLRHIVGRQELSEIGPKKGDLLSNYNDCKKSKKTI